MSSATDYQSIAAGRQNCKEQFCMTKGTRRVSYRDVAHKKRPGPFLIQAFVLFGSSNCARTSDPWINSDES
jgi:hypothetical protein